MSAHILIVEDDALQRMSLKDLCLDLGYVPVEAGNGEEALFMAANHPEIGLVVTDLNMPVMDGRELVKQLKTRHPDLPVMVVTISREVDDVIGVMRDGAQDFITKPIEHGRFEVSVRNLLEKRTLRREVQRLKRKESGALRFADMIGHDTGLKKLCAVGQKVAQSDLPVLISGESGVGKEMIARAIHGQSRRHDKPFIAINCAAIPQNLAESTLFGHAKGAFTGAVGDALGKFREAQGGTIFLDEIGELPLEIQAKLLRALQEKEIEPVGVGKAVAIDTRVVSATNRNLHDEVAHKRFREDLFFRLNVLKLEVPPLRDRRGDIEALAEYVIDRVAATEGKPVKKLSRDALAWLQAYAWPGNVRELENMLSGAFFIADGREITREDLLLLAENAAASDSATMLSDDGVIQLCHVPGQLKTLEAIQDEVVAYALKLHDDNVTKAAQALDIGRSTLFKRLKERESGAA